MTRAVATAQRRAAPSVQARLYAAAQANYVPLGVVFEVTRGCNLTCQHCYVSESASVPLSLARSVELIDEVAEAGCLGVSLTGGELALRHGWQEIADRVRQRRMMVTFMTNGTLWGPEDWRFVAGLRPRRVCVSLYASEASGHDAVTGVPGSFEASMRTLHGLRQLGVRCRMGTVMMPGNIGEVMALRTIADDLGCEFLFDPTVQPCDDGSMGVVDLRVSAEALGAFYSDEVIARRSKEGRIAFAEGKPKARMPHNCQAGITGAFIGASGEVYPCMGFMPSFGSVATQGFLEVWRGPVAMAHREAMMRPLGDCQACDLKDYCTTRCPRLALVEDGDLSGPSKRACELAGLVRDLRRT